MSRSMSCQENVLEWLKGAETATVTFSQGKYISKIRKLAEKFPEECKIKAENPDGSIVASIPVKWIKISKVTRTTREYTEEEKRKFVEKLHGARRNAPKTGDSTSEDS